MLHFHALFWFFIYVSLLFLNSPRFCVKKRFPRHQIFRSTAQLASLSGCFGFVAQWVQWLQDGLLVDMERIPCSQRPGRFHVAERRDLQSAWSWVHSGSTILTGQNSKSVWAFSIIFYGTCCNWICFLPRINVFIKMQLSFMSSASIAALIPSCNQPTNWPIKETR